MDPINSIKERMSSLSRLNREEHFQLRNDILRYRPEWYRPWWWLYPCEVNVLIVTDDWLHYGAGGFGLSTFLTTFKQLELDSSSNLKYKVTLAHRTNPGLANMQDGNPDIEAQITYFKFNNTAHFTPTKYDQVWLFGFDTGYTLLPAELTAIEEYMDKGGGLFATGDHGALGKSLCGSIQRVKDMRYWADTPPGTENEVGMDNYRRNDTNQPKPGQSSSVLFANQSDNIPQNIHARLYGGSPHPLLSAPTSVSASGIVHYMPDHPHEGECQPETSFTVTKNGTVYTIPTQNIATSFVPAGNTTSQFPAKAPTVAHCFPSIGVWDGRIAGMGRIVVDATWHHFVNVNLQGFDAPTYAVVEQYYKNIARWMSRRKFMFCLYERVMVHALSHELVIESTLLDPRQDLSNISLHDLQVIGQHTIDVVREELSPADGTLFKLALLEPIAPELAARLNPWNPQETNEQNNMFRPWLDPDPVITIALGHAMIHLRDQFGSFTERIDEEMESQISRVFQKGLREGLERSTQAWDNELSRWTKLQDQFTKEDYLVEGTILGKNGEPLAGVRVRAVDQDFVGENRLGEDTTTDTDGKYSIPYKYTDFVIDGKESGGADIVIYVYDQNGELLYKSDIHSNSPKVRTIDIQID